MINKQYPIKYKITNNQFGYSNSFGILFDAKQNFKRAISKNVKKTLGQINAAGVNGYTHRQIQEILRDRNSNMKNGVVYNNNDDHKRKYLGSL